MLTEIFVTVMVAFLPVFAIVFVIKVIEALLDGIDNMDAIGNACVAIIGALIYSAVFVITSSFKAILAIGKWLSRKTINKKEKQQIERLPHLFNHSKRKHLRKLKIGSRLYRAYGKPTTEAEVELFAALYPTQIPGNFIVLSDLYIPTSQGTSQIDIVMIHEQGIFVFESKDYKGNISGKLDDWDWIQNCGSSKFLLYNPIRQNEGHIKALADFLKIDRSLFISYVVFSDRGNLQDILSRIHSVYLSNQRDVIWKLRKEILPNKSKILRQMKSKILQQNSALIQTSPKK